MPPSAHDLTKAEAAILEYLAQPRSVEDLASKAEELNFSATELEKKIEDWVRNQIIVLL